MKTKQYIENLSKAAMEDAFKELPIKIKSVMDGALLSLIGLEHKEYNNYQIDHCNGRWNLFEEILKIHAKNELIALMKDLRLRFPVEGFKDTFKTSFISEFNSQIKYYAKQTAEEKAKQYINKYLDEMIKDIEKKDIIIK